MAEVKYANGFMLVRFSPDEVGDHPGMFISSLRSMMMSELKGPANFIVFDTKPDWKSFAVMASLMFMYRVAGVKTGKSMYVVYSTVPEFRTGDVIPLPDELSQ